MKSERGMLKVGSLYKLRDHDGYIMECIRVITDSSYSPYCARLRSTVTGWTIDCMGINIYDDGSIDWDFSINGIFTERKDDGTLYQVMR